MKQQSFASLEWQSKKRSTRREVFPAEMERAVPWEQLVALSEPHDLKSGRVGRQAVPDATTLVNLRKLLLQHDPGQAMPEQINAMLGQRGLLMHKGTVVHATIIAAPSSTKNQDQARDPEMRQTKKGNQWHFGMTMRSGVDVDSGLINRVHSSAANEVSVAHAQDLRHGQKRALHADTGYAGVQQRQEIVQAQQQRRLRQDIGWREALKRSALKAMPEDTVGQRASKGITKVPERVKAKKRVIVEHPFHVIKNLFGYRKVSYRGLVENALRAQMHAALAKVLKFRAAPILDGRLQGVGAGRCRKHGLRRPQNRAQAQGSVKRKCHLGASFSHSENQCLQEMRATGINDCSAVP